MSFLLDTNVVSEWTKPEPEPAVVHWLRAVDEQATYLSVVSIGELRRGMLLLDEGRRKQLLLSWLEEQVMERFAGRILPVDVRTAEAWSVLMAEGQRSGTSIDAVDALIGASALAHELTLVTRNTRHFAWSKVALLDPWTSPGPGTD